MSGNKDGAAKARTTNLKRDPEYYSKIGKIGGSRRVKKGFATMPRERIQEIGRKGGLRGSVDKT